MQDDPGGAGGVQAVHRDGEAGGEAERGLLRGVEAGRPDVPLLLQELRPAALPRHRSQAGHAAPRQVQHRSSPAMLRRDAAPALSFCVLGGVVVEEDMQVLL